MKAPCTSLLFILMTTLACGSVIQRAFVASQEDAPVVSPSRRTDSGWPREITRNGVRLVYYQPQVDQWDNLRELRARFAFVLTPPNGKPVVGVEEVRGNTQASEESKKTVEVKTDPPPIFFSTRPAILLTVQGDPVLGPIKGLQLKFVVNANWDLFFVPRGSRYYLLVDKVWLTTDSLSGSWTAAEKLPAELRKLPSGENWDHVQKAVAAWVPGNSKAPKVFYAAEPAELIAFAGEPVYKKIAGTELSYATNTDS